MSKLNHLILFLIFFLTLTETKTVFAQSTTNRLQEQIKKIQDRQERIEIQEESFKELQNFELNLEINNTPTVTNTQTPSLTPAISPSNIPTFLPPEINVTPTDEIEYSRAVLDSVSNCTNPLNVAIYKQAESITGISWKALAAIHYMEGNCNLNQSLVSGRRIGQIEPDVGRKCSSSDIGIGKPIPIGEGCGFRNLLDSAIYAGYFLKNNKFNGQIPRTVEDLAYAFGRYNGTGNRNCGKTPYQFCPPAFDNDDHIYAMSKYSKKHETMYLVYCADRTVCNPPRIFQRIGALAVINIINSSGL